MSIFAEKHSNLVSRCDRLRLRISGCQRKKNTESNSMKTRKKKQKKMNSQTEWFYKQKVFEKKRMTMGMSGGYRQMYLTGKSVMVNYTIFENNKRFAR